LTPSLTPHIQIQNNRTNPLFTWKDSRPSLIIWYFSPIVKKEAEDIVSSDPLLTEKAVADYWIKDWIP